MARLFAARHTHGMQSSEHSSTDHALVTSELNSPQLAYNGHGSRFVVPPRASEWRVFKKPERGGRPKSLNTADGPAYVDINASFRELAEIVPRPGWYLLQAVDPHRKAIEGIPHAHVEVVQDVAPIDAFEVGQETCADPSAMAIKQLTSTLQQSMRAAAERETSMIEAFTEMASKVFSGFSEVQKSTAELIIARQAPCSPCDALRIEDGIRAFVRRTPHNPTDLATLLAVAEAEARLWGLDGIHAYRRAAVDLCRHLRHRR